MHRKGFTADMTKLKGIDEYESSVVVDVINNNISLHNIKTSGEGHFVADAGSKEPPPATASKHGWAATTPQREPNPSIAEPSLEAGPVAQVRQPVVARTPTGPPLRVLIRDHKSPAPVARAAPEAAEEDRGFRNASNQSSQSEDKHYSSKTQGSTSKLATTPKRAVHGSKGLPTSDANPVNIHFSSPPRSAVNTAAITPKRALGAAVSTPLRTASKVSGGGGATNKQREAASCAATPTRHTLSASKLKSSNSAGTPKRTDGPHQPPKSSMRIQSPTKATPAAALTSSKQLIIRPATRRVNVDRPAASGRDRPLAAEIRRSRSFCSNLSPVNNVSGLTCDYVSAADEADLSMNTFTSEPSASAAGQLGHDRIRVNVDALNASQGLRARNDAAPGAQGKKSGRSLHAREERAKPREGKIPSPASRRQLIFPASKESTLSNINNCSNSASTDSVINDMNVLHNHPVWKGSAGASVDDALSLSAGLSSPRNMQMHLQQLRQSASNNNLNSIDRSSNIIMNSNTFDYSEVSTSNNTLNKGMIVFDSIDTAYLGASISSQTKDDNVSGIITSGSNHNILLSSIDFQKDCTPFNSTIFSTSDITTTVSNANNIAFYRKIGRARGNRYSSDCYGDDSDGDCGDIIDSRNSSVVSAENINESNDGSSYQNSSLSLTAIKICNSNYETDNSFERDYINEFIANASTRSSGAGYSIGLGIDASSNSLTSGQTNANNRTIATDAGLGALSATASSSNINNTISIASSTASYEFSSVVGVFQNTTSDITGLDIDSSSSFSFCAEVNTDTISTDLGNSRETCLTSDPVARQLEMGVGLPAPFYSASFIPLHPLGEAGQAELWSCRM